MTTRKFLNKYITNSNNITHQSLINGKWNIPKEYVNELHSYLVNDYNNGIKNHLIEKIKDNFKFNLDIELKDNNYTIEEISKAAKELINENYGESYSDYSIV